MKKLIVLNLTAILCLGATSIITIDTFASSSVSNASKWGHLDSNLHYTLSLCEDYIYNENTNNYLVNTTIVEEVIVEENHISEIISFNDEQIEILNKSVSLIGIKMGSVKDNKFITLVCDDTDANKIEIVGYIPSESSSWINVEIINAFLNKTKHEYNFMYNNDVDTIDSFMEETVLLMFANELINIQEYTDFNPYENITRGEVVSILSKYSDEDLSNYISSSFDDVDNNSDYMKHIEWAKNIGIVNGVSTTEFAPNEYITREQLSVILNNYIEYYNLDIWKYERDFTDFEEVSTWAVESVKDTIMYTGFTKEDENMYFNPKHFASKLDVCFALEQIIN